VGPAYFTRRHPGRHRLDALALTRQQQAGQIRYQRGAPVGVAENGGQALDVPIEASAIYRTTHAGKW
jgi:hypothetical protein